MQATKTRADAPIKEKHNRCSREPAVTFDRNPPSSFAVILIAPPGRSFWIACSRSRHENLVTAETAALFCRRPTPTALHCHPIAASSTTIAVVEVAPISAIFLMAVETHRDDFSGLVACFAT